MDGRHAIRLPVSGPGIRPRRRGCRVPRRRPSGSSCCSWPRWCSSSRGPGSPGFRRDWPEPVSRFPPGWPASCASRSVNSAATATGTRAARSADVLSAVRLHPDRAVVRPVHRTAGHRGRSHGAVRPGHSPRPGRLGCDDLAGPRSCRPDTVRSRQGRRPRVGFVNARAGLTDLGVRFRRWPPQPARRRRRRRRMR